MRLEQRPLAGRVPGRALGRGVRLGQGRHGGHSSRVGRTGLSRRVPRGGARRRGGRDRGGRAASVRCTRRGTSRARRAAGPRGRARRPGPPGVRCGTRMKPSEASSCTCRSISSATLRRRADEPAARGDRDDQVADRPVVRRRQLAPRGDDGTRVLEVPRAATRDVGAVEVGLDVRQRTLRVVGRQVAAPDLLEEGDRRRAGHLLAADVPRQLLRLVVGVPDDDRRRGQDLQRARLATLRGEACLDVVVERASGVERRVQREDHVRGRGREVAAVGRVARPGRAPGGPAVRAASGTRRAPGSACRRGRRGAPSRAAGRRPRPGPGSRRRRPTSPTARGRPRRARRHARTAPRRAGTRRGGSSRP